MSTSEWQPSSVQSLATDIAAERVSARDVVESALDVLERHSEGNAMITVCADRARRKAERPLAGPLAGVPFVAKDMFDTAGVRTTYGSKVFQDRVPARSASAVVMLERAGAILLGKANQHEFAWGSTSQNPHFGNVANPRYPELVAGGSSGGTAAAIALGACSIGLGTDTGGSVRIPAACCDVVGFKPSYGAISVRGVGDLAKPFDTVGLMGSTVADCSLMYSIFSGRSPVPPRESLHGLRIGVIDSPGHERELGKLGAHLVESDFPFETRDAESVFLVECARTHRELFAKFGPEYGPDVYTKFERAFAVGALEYLEGLSALRALRLRASARMDEVDLLISPSLGVEPPDRAVWEPDVRAGLSRYTRIYNFLGWPAISVGKLQFAGRDDALVLACADLWERTYRSAG